MKYMFMFPSLLVAMALLGSLSSAEVVNLALDGQFQDITYKTSGQTQTHGYLKLGSTDYGTLNQWTISGTNYFGSVNSNTSQHHLIGFNGHSDEFATMIENYGNILFLQYYEGASSQARQTITGLEVGKTYYISANVATRQTGLNLGISLMGNNSSEAMVDWSTANTPGIIPGGLLPFSQSFVATDTTATLTLANNTTTNDKASAGFQNLVISETKPTGWTSYKRWTDDAPLDANGTYTHAINFQSSGGGQFLVNGITFNSINGKNAETNSSFSRTKPGDALNLSVPVTGNSAQLAAGFATIPKTGGTFELTGLLPGFEYETTIFSNMWGENSRKGLITVNNKTPLLYMANLFEGRISCDSNQGTALTWNGLASQAGSIQIDFLNSSDPIHIHGLANRFVSAPEGTHLGATFSGANGQLPGTTMIGTEVDTFNALSEPNTTWQVRGANHAASDLQYADYQGALTAKLGPNTGSALKLGGDSWTSLAGTELEFKVDIAMGTLTSDTNYKYARGAGFGFFSNKFGTRSWDYVSRGFSGLVVAPDGALYFYSNMSNSDLDNTYSELIPYTGSWDPEDFNTLSFTAWLSADGETATLTGVSFEGSSSDYSSLLGKVFQTTDYLGLSSSGSRGGTFSYYDNLLVQNKVPEPSTWAILVLGLAGILYWRKRTY